MYTGELSEKNHPAAVDTAEILLELDPKKENIKKTQVIRKRKLEISNYNIQL